MSTTELILSLECSLLALFILLMVGSLILYKWKSAASGSTNRPNDPRSRNYIVLPHTNAEPVQLERNVKQVNDQNVENSDGADHPLLDDRTEAGRLYFSLKYDEKKSIITIKLIKGENLPLLTKDETRAFVSVQVISNKTDQKTQNKDKTVGTNYQKTYRFSLSASDFASHTILFEVSRFDRFSKKYDVGHVTVSLVELEVDIRRETFFTRNISAWKNTQLSTITSSHSTTPYPDKSEVLRRVRKDSKSKQRPSQMLWHKLSHAVHAGLYQGLLRGRHESLQWDPFLIIQKYEYADSDEYIPPGHQELSKNNRKRHHEFGEDEENLELFSEVFNSATKKSSVTTSSPQPSDSSPEREALQTPVNREFYRLVHSPALSQSDSSEPVTSWSIPETFHFPPSPVRLQSSTVVFQSTPASCRAKHDRLHKLTSLSSSYRKRLLRKSRKRAASRRGKLSRMEPLHRLPLYLNTRADRSFKRLRGEEARDSKK